MTKTTEKVRDDTETLSTFTENDIRFEIALVKVEKEWRESIYDKPQMSNETEQMLNDYQFRDDTIDVSWNVGRSRLDFRLANRSNQTIKVLWDEAAIVHTHGVSSMVLHSGVKYIDAGKTQRPTVVPKGATITDTIMPVDCIRFSDTTKDWVERPLLPVLGLASVETIWYSEKLNRPILDIFTYTRSEMQAQTDAYIGSTLGVLLPLVVGIRPCEYTFTFEVKGAEIGEGQPVVPEPAKPEDGLSALVLLFGLVLFAGATYAILAGLIE